MWVLKNPEKDKSKINIVIGETKSLTHLLGDWRIVQVKREKNRVTNTLTNLVR